MFVNCSRAYSGIHAVLLCSLLSCSCYAPAFANSLLDSLLKNANSHDFVSYFDFAENKTVKRDDGLTDHSYYSKVWTCFLVLSVDNNGRVVHMKLGVPRPLIDDENVCTRGRDIVKSFVLASAIGQDIPKLKVLADEIYVRGLDLHAIKVDPKKVDPHDSPPHMQAYKIGKGPLSNGDSAIFLAQMPKLAPKPSELFEGFMGKRPKIRQIYQNCRLAFMNDDMNVSKSQMKLLWCDTWDESYFKAHSIGSPNRGKNNGLKQ